MSFDRDQALGRATVTFWARGYQASSLQDLLAATGLSKSSLYQQFGNKQQLFDHCLAHYSNEMEEMLQQLLQHAPSGQDFIRMMLTQIINEPRPAIGCLVFSTASEFGQSDPQVADRLKSSLARFRRVFLQALEQDKATGLLAPDADTSALADYLMTSIGGLRTMAKLGADPHSLKSTVAIVLKSLG